ncbi:MAG: ribonuclease HII [Candidatus Hydrothermarchaeota archaeon]
MIVGIDEAGRGPVIGPLVICGVAVKKNEIFKLEEIGLRDSKKISSRRRIELREVLEEIVEKYHVRIISPRELDEKRKRTTLNKIEALEFAKIISELSPEIAIVDACDRDPVNFLSDINHYLRNQFRIENQKIICEHFADEKYPIVSAASIFAKVIRDLEIEKIRERYGDVGSGYTSDPVTINFLKEWIKINDEYPDFVRKSWIAAKKIKEAKFQRKLSEWGPI